MNSKVLCINLLLAVFCLWTTEASPLEALTMEHSVQDAMDETPAKGYPADDDYRAQVHEKRAAYAGAVAKKLSNKAKVLEAESRLSGQIAKDRYYYYREYTKLAEDAKNRAREYEQQSYAERSRIGGHQAKQKEWESKYREAETQCKDEDLRAQKLYSQSRDLLRNSEVAYSAAAIHGAQASGYQCKADRMTDWSREMKRRAESMLNEAKTHYTRGKELENRATAEKVRAHQQAEDSQKHHAASRAYQQDCLRIRLASRANIMKYIQNSLMAERYRNAAKEEELRSEFDETIARDAANKAEQNSAIAKILTSEFSFYAARAKHYQTRSMVMSQSSREIQSSATASGNAMLQMVQAKEESPEMDSSRKFSIHPAEDPIRALPSEDTKSFLYNDEGM